MIRKKLSILFIMTCLFIFSGCSKKAEEMNTVRPKLILEIMKLTKQKRYEEAYIQIKKLQVIDPSNAHLPTLEDTTKNNAELKKINTLFAQSNSQKDASVLLKHFVEQQGKASNSKARYAAVRLQDVMRLDALTDLIINPKPDFKGKKGFRPASKVLKDSIEEFIRISQRRNLAPHLRRKVIKKMPHVAKLRREEAERAALSLELFAPGLSESSYQTMMAISGYTAQSGTKRK